MSTLTLGLIDGLLAATKSEDVDKGLIRGYFENVGHVDDKALASRILGSVLKSLESDQSITELHRRVLKSLVNVLKHQTPTSNGTSNDTPNGNATVASASAGDLVPSNTVINKSDVEKPSSLGDDHGDASQTSVAKSPTQEVHNSATIYNDAVRGKSEEPSAPSNGHVGPSGTSIASLLVEEVQKSQNTESVGSPVPSRDRDEDVSPATGHGAGTQQVSDKDASSRQASGGSDQHGSGKTHPEVASEERPRKLLPHEWRSPIPAALLKAGSSNFSEGSKDKSGAGRSQLQDKGIASLQQRYNQDVSQNNGDHGALKSKDDDDVVSGVGWGAVTPKANWGVETPKPKSNLGELFQSKHSPTPSESASQAPRIW
ncbi:hypothetical protein F4819DRAFT_488363 [Hypoxylon fuscum]|nr:hypothetical protein F4819DRAFT_488363 [Hypoxylon fuscum]